MSRPPILTLPDCARAYRLETARGAFAVHEWVPPAGSPRRGTALLVPGFTGSKEDFIALLQPLARAGYRAVAVDGRGQHETPGPCDEAAYAQSELARDVHAQVAALADGPVHLLGHSLGGLVSRAAVLLDAAPFRSFTVMSSGPAAISESEHARLALLVDALSGIPAGDGREAGMEAVWQAMQAIDPPADLAEEHDAQSAEETRSVTEFLHRRWLGNVPEQLIATGRQLVSEPDRVAELAGTGVPVHVISGERDYAWPVPLLDAMAARLGARRTRIKRAEHSPNAEQPEATARALLEFWNTV